MNSLPYNNFSLFWDNLSGYYVTTLFITFLAVFVTWWICNNEPMKEPGPDRSSNVSKQLPQTVRRNVYYNPVTDNSKMMGDDRTDSDSLVTKFKMCRQRAMAQQLTGGLSEEQLRQEKETEKAQLAAIFELLRQQEEKFQVSSMEELEEQLRLYRR